MFMLWIIGAMIGIFKEIITVSLTMLISVSRSAMSLVKVPSIISVNVDFIVEKIATSILLVV